MFVAVLFIYLGLINTPWLLNKLGLFDYGRWFLDSYAILATNDAVALGHDPAAPNPLDVFRRPHSYSSWWLHLRHLGLERSDNFLFGSAIVGCFLLTAVPVLRPRDKREAWIGAAVLVSPPVLLALLRANNDLVVFAVLALGVLALRVSPAWGALGLVLSMVVATGLKFYPLLGVAAFLTLPARQRWWGMVLAISGSGAVLVSEWSWFQRATIPVPESVYLFGAPAWWRELGIATRPAMLMSAIALSAGAVLAARRGWTTGLSTEDGRVEERASFALGAALLVGCWLAGISFSYRWVFALLLLPWLWRRWKESGVARTVLIIILITVWADGLFCLSVNVGFGPLSEPQLRAAEHWWLIVSQPAVWLLMVFLGGWLLDLGCNGLREIQTAVCTRWPRPPIFLLWLLVCAGWLGLASSDRVRTLQGVSDHGMWFLDSYAVLAASDAHRAGIDVTTANPLDPLNRPHRYSDWWLFLGRLGLGREDNFAVGLAWCMLFAVAVAATMRCRDWSEAIWIGAVLLSPSVWQGLLRANNDLVIFSILAVALLALGRLADPWRWLAPIAMATAAGLKFYPAVAVVALVIFLPERHGWLKLTAGLVACLLSLWAVAGQWQRGIFPIEISVHVWGGRILPGDLGATAGVWPLAAVLIVGASLAFPFLRATAGHSNHGEARANKVAFLLSAAVLVSCFVAGLNYGYRWIFALWLGPWLWTMKKVNGGAPYRALWLGVPVLLWADGLLCIAVNSGALGLVPGDFPGVQHLWRLTTQPIHWLFICGVTGCAAALLLEIIRGDRAKGIVTA